MSLEADLLLDRRRLKRRLLVWRVVGVLALLGCVLIGVGRGWSVAPASRVARLTVAGIITDDRKRTERIDALADDAGVRALIVDIDSPGGSVAGGEALHHAIARVAAKKPVVAVMRGTAASAGYMIAVPAARIFAGEATLTGSIGVILETGEASGLLARLGITAEAITSGPLKDQPNPAHPLSDQGRAVLHGLVMDMFDQFVGMVADGRHMPPDAVRGLADGRAYTGRQALKLGLIDEIGGDAAARAWLASARGVPASLPERAVERPGGLLRGLGLGPGGVLGAILEAGRKTVLGQSVMLDGAWALWQPGMTEP